MKLVTTRGVREAELGVVDAREVERTRGLVLTHREAEGPRESGKIVEHVVGKIGTVHLGNDVVMVDVRGVLEEGYTVDVQSRLAEVVRIRPRITRSLTGYEVKRFYGVVEVGEINLGVGVGAELMLGLGDEKFMLGIHEEVTLVRVEIHVVAVHFRRTHGVVSVAALDAKFDVVVLERDEGETLGPVLGEEEWDEEMVTAVVFLDDGGRHGGRRLGGVVT